MNLNEIIYIERIMADYLEEIKKVEIKFHSGSKLKIEDFFPIVNSIKFLLEEKCKKENVCNTHFIPLVDFVRKSKICKLISLTSDRISYHFRKTPENFKNMFNLKTIEVKTLYMVDPILLEEKLKQIKWKGKCENEILKKFLQEEKNREFIQSIEEDHGQEDEKSHKKNS